MTIRPLRPEDAADAAACTRIALGELYPEELSPAELAIRITSGTARVAHLQSTDPDGCWVADCDGRVVGAALGFIRERMWGLSLFAILPEFQGQGIGNRLYAPALAYGADAPGALILSSSHPAAIRRYARSPGFALVPTVGLTGIVDASRMPATLRCRAGDLAADAETIEAASRHVRGASHLRDLRVHLDRPGMTLLVIDGEGFACALEGSPTLLAARTRGGRRGPAVGRDHERRSRHDGRLRLRHGGEPVGDPDRPGGGVGRHRLRPAVRARAGRADGAVSAKWSIFVTLGFSFARRGR